uniref:Protein kinase domain-containing protein n=1 Tax=Cryptomonas curvata TaxID=233186 RepID=A0A7S0QCZ8_9CRYP
MDVFLAMNGMPPVVLVEEKWGDADLPIAIQDIDRKFCTIPHYSSKMLFIMAIAIAGDLVCFGKLYLGGKFEHIKTFNLRSGLKERVYCVRAAINVGRWARYVLDNNFVAPITFPMGKKQVQDRRELTILSEGVILKKYLKVSKAQRGWLSHLYKRLSSAAQRKVRYLEWAISVATSAAKSTVTVRLQPFGVVRFPQSLMEMRSALRCVLTCLADLHKEGWTHLDLRWSNVVFVAQHQWFVIDAEFARPIGSAMPEGLVLRDPDAAMADEGADCFLVGVMMQDPRSRVLLSGIESAQELAEYLYNPIGDARRQCTAAQALGMSFVQDGS